MTSESCAELVNMLENHIGRIKEIESKVYALADMKVNGEINDSIYKCIVEIVMQKFHQFNGGMDVLMCLTDEYLPMLSHSTS